jgi:hypothetical protein
MNHSATASPSLWPTSTSHVERPPSAPVRARSTNDLVSERERGWTLERQRDGLNIDEMALNSSKGDEAEARADPKESVEHGPYVQTLRLRAFPI